MPFKPGIIILILFFPGSLVLGQQTSINYAAKWNKVDSLITKKGLTQSALTEVNAIYALAKKDKNDAELIKSLLYRINLEKNAREDALQKSTTDLDKEIQTAKEPAKSILQSILAETYWDYFQSNRWKFYSRKTTDGFKKEDPASWSPADFHQKISSLFVASLNNEKILEQTSLEKFNPIIVAGNLRYLRPTLFDFLAFRALDYFKSDESDLSRPSYAFEISNPRAFAPAGEFVRTSFSTKDSFSIHYHALLIFQSLIKFHLSDPQPDAWIDADIQRIQFVRQYGVMENKEDLYFDALKNITHQFPGNKTAASAWYLQAQSYATMAATYDPLKDTTHRYDYLEAKTICENVLKQADSSQGKSDCELLLRQILRKEMIVEAEKVNVPGQPFRMLISYRNNSLLHFRIIRLDRKTKQNLTINPAGEDFWESLTKLNAATTFYETLPETGDHQLHRVEIKINALDPGMYCLLASTEKSFDTENNHLAAEFFDVSDISYVNNGPDYFVLNRETGQPMPATDVQVWYRYYDNKQSKQLERKGENFNTDKNGFFHISPSKTNNYNSVSFEFTTTNDHLWLDNEGYNTYYRNDNDDDDTTDYEKDNLRTFFFMDRSIYRPGQIAFFKGILITKDLRTKKSKILGGYKTTVYLNDANSTRIDSLQLTTNEFGSFHGQFKLPENVLTGKFSLEDASDDNDQSFSVEEYKRPRFEVQFEKKKGSYRLGDSVHVTGTAIAFSGNNVDGALVKYRVVRKARSQTIYYRWNPVSNNQTEITHGETRTGSDGKFRIGFVSLPDKAMPINLDPVFDYEITTDITDINGETRTGTETISVGYKTLQLTISAAFGKALTTDSFNRVQVSTQNLMGEFEPAEVRLSVYSLKSPDRLIRKRYWQQPDQFLMKKEEYIGYFPSDEYSDESSKENWPKSKLFELSDSSKPNGQFDLNRAANLPSFWPGWYLLEAVAKDKYGQEVKNIMYVQLTDAKTGNPGAPEYNWVFGNYEIAQPGQIARLQTGSSAKNLFIIRAKSDAGESARESTNTNYLSNYSFSSLNNERKTYEIPVTEANRGGFGISTVFVKDNRVYTNDFTVSVPWSNKELLVRYETFREKTLPGSEEKWKIHVTGDKREKISSEILMSMYDASLDQFGKQNWTVPDIYPYYTPSYERWTGRTNFSAQQSFSDYWTDYPGKPHFIKQYDHLLNRQELVFDLGTRRGISANAQLNDVVVTGYSTQKRKEMTGSVMVIRAAADTISNSASPEVEKFPGNVSLRKNFNETAFFFPDLRTDDSGNVEFSFTMPEALTQWKWMTLAHTKDLSFGYSEKTIVTQKQLMIQPNAPRFVRQGDHMELSVKVVNLTDSEMTGQAFLQLIDPGSNQSVDGWFSNRQASQYFTAAAGQSTDVSFPIDVPFQYNSALTYRIVAKAGNFSDGEEASLPVLSNRILVTESLPLTMSGPGTKHFKFEKLLKSDASETLTQDGLTVEFTSNPAWYAVQSLPYIIEFPYECAEQTFNRFYGNALASKIAASAPRLQEVFRKWENDSSALMSNLQKNEELKSVLLQETPWVLQAKSETEQKKNIALLFDMNRMTQQLDATLAKFSAMQSDGGGFAWFRGGRDDRYITQYILTGIGHLKKLDAIPVALSSRVNPIVQKALAWLDKKIVEDYEDSKKRAGKNTLADDISGTQIQYLYLRSFFPEYAIPGATFPAVNYYRKQAQQSWLKQNKYMQGMIALALFRTGDVKTAKDILASLKQNAIVNDELGMYWKENTAGYYWYQAPVETQSLLIETFAEITKDVRLVNNLRTWLLKQKQTQHWATTKSTADACYAILLQGSDWLSASPKVSISMGDMNISSAETSDEEGYLKKTIRPPFLKPDLGNITVTLSGNPGSQGGPAWGSAYWQYFDDMDKINPSSSTNPLRLSKKLFVQRQTDKGIVLEPVAENAYLKVGDKVTVRIEVRTDRDMEYVHLKDMRASCMEPVSVLSEYKWQDGLGYYESTRDASTNFFFSALPKGTYVFAYDLFVANAGTFSNGITTIQCMYAPEFMSHSEGVKVNVENRE